MIRNEVHEDISREVDLFAEIMGKSRTKMELAKVGGYEVDHLYVRGYMEDSDPHDEHRYYHDMLVPAIESLTSLLQNARYIEFEQLSVENPSGSVIQTLGGGSDYGFWLRKTTSYQFCIPGEVCPKHVAPEGYYGSDDLDNCPEDCDFVPKFKGFGPGTQVIYDVKIRSFPRLRIK
jgi:hypothetical protein